MSLAGHGRPGPPESPVEAEDLLRLADGVSLGLIRFDERLRVALANEAAHRALERRAGTLTGRSLMETFLDQRVESLVRSASEGRAGSHETGSTERRRLLVRSRPAEGGGAWVTIEDVTRLRRLERMRSELVDDLSHELRTPVTNIRLLIELLVEELRGLELPERVRERIATIDVETGHLAQMVSELLDLARIEQATSPLAAEEVDAASLVTATLARLRTFAERLRIRLESELPPDLPAVRGDEERLGQLLVNLLHNAITFSPEGARVRVSAQEEGGRLVIRVTDEGEGIPAAEQERVFERFYKVDRARRRGRGGTGLGLAIARHIAEAHGGRLWLESREGEGSTFSFSVPLA